MSADYPQNLFSYYSNSSEFEQRGNSQKKIIYYVLAAVCLLLIIKPDLIPIGNLIVRILGVLGLVVFAVGSFLITSDYYNTKSGGKINTLPVKKFDSSKNNEETILNMFHNNDVEGLINAPSSENQPIQLYIHEDEMGKTFYLQLMKYFSESEFKGISEVKVLSGSEYAKTFETIKGIK